VTCGPQRKCHDPESFAAVARGRHIKEKQMKPVRWVERLKTVMNSDVCHKQLIEEIGYGEYLAKAYWRLDYFGVWGLLWSMGVIETTSIVNEKSIIRTLATSGY